MHSAPYIYTSGTVPVKEKDADYIFYQTWSDGRVQQKNCDVLPTLTRVTLVNMDARVE